MKGKIKVISLVLVMLLSMSLIFILGSCDTKNPMENETEAPPQEKPQETGEFTEKVLKEIQNAYFKKTYTDKSKGFYNSPNQVEVTFYGSFDNAYCIKIRRPGEGFDTAITFVEVAGFEFTFPDSNTMSVYYDGKFYSLQAAYENGILDDAEIAELWELYVQIAYGGNAPDYKHFSRIKPKIQLAFLEKVYGEEYKLDSYMPEDVPIECYGVFDDAYCVILWDKLGGQFGTITEVTVAGQTFVYETPDMIQVYCNEVLYDLPEAYENGILDESEIAELYRSYNRVWWVDDDPTELTEDIKREIQIARLIEAFGEDYAENGYTPEDVTLDCYGIFDNAYCVDLLTPDKTVFPAEKTIKIEQYEFRFGQEVMRVYFEGKLYDLDEAYEIGILDKSDIAELHDYYMKSNWYK